MSLALPALRAAEESILVGNLKTFAANRLAMVSALVCLGFCLVALLAPWLAPQDPYESDLLRRLQPPHALLCGRGHRLATARGLVGRLGALRALPPCTTATAISYRASTNACCNTSSTGRIVVKISITTYCTCPSTRCTESICCIASSTSKTLISSSTSTCARLVCSTAT